MRGWRLRSSNDSLAAVRKRSAASGFSSAMSNPISRKMGYASPCGRSNRRGEMLLGMKPCRLASQPTVFNPMMSSSV